MRKRICFLMTMMICIILVTMGCGKDTKKAKESTKTEFSIWSTYNTKKVIQQSTRNDSYKHLPAKLNVQMMQGEREGAQLIVTADRDMRYELVAGEMKSDSGNVIPAENITIFQQNYIEITNNTNGTPEFSAGDYIPDMLLPMETAIAYGENAIKEGNNQGITVEFNSEGVESGIYTGTFLLDIDGEKTEIPATVEIWDISYEGRRTFQTSFLLYQSELLVGEYNNTDEVIDSYVDFLMDYKANTYVIRDNNSVERFLGECKMLFADENCNALIIPCSFPRDYTVYNGDQLTDKAEEVLAYIKELAKISTEETPYIEYAYFYPTEFDESDLQGLGAQAYEFYKKDGQLQKTLEVAIDQLRSEGWFAKQTPQFAKRVENAIRNIPSIFTNTKFMEEWVMDNTWYPTFCPLVNAFDSTATRQKIQNAAEERSDGNLWTYHCSDPRYPYPTFHIDDTTLGVRVSGWMYKAYDFTGFLYYQVNKNTFKDENPKYDYLDVYGTAARYFYLNGDGFVVYPGGYYESESPFASLRLVAHRDSMDDYDMLCVYETMLQEYAVKNNITNFDANEYVMDLYDSLFKGTVAKNNDGKFYQAREELANRILALKNGELVHPEADKEQMLLTNFTEGTAGVTANEKSSITKGKSGTAQVVIKAESKDKGTEVGSKTKLFRPYFSIPVKDFGNAENLYFTWTNHNDYDMEMQITLVTESGDKEIVDTCYLAAGKNRKVRVHFQDDLQIDKSKVSEIRLTFDNVRVGQDGTMVLQVDRTMSFSDFRLVLK